MRILVACEESQEVTKAFRAHGHEAYSCDLLECSGGHPEWHFQQDMFVVYDMHKWDMVIAFPPCTYLCSSGLHWNKKDPQRAAKTDEALAFVRAIMRLKVPKLVIENSVGCISTKIAKPTQIIQPYNFGEDASKSTCLWLRGVPKLVDTGYVPPRWVNGKPRWSNQTDSGQNKLGPSEERGLLRSKTYRGIANAMAEQWGVL